MPSKNIVREDAPDTYYHVYARGASKQDIFLDDSDHRFFMSLFARYLSVEQKSHNGTVYPHLRDEIELLAYCLMPNHFHLLVFQYEAGALTQLMRGVMTSYSRYFNKKYDRSGSMFESRFKSSRISNDQYLMHISRYVHLNPRYYKRYAYSSHHYYMDVKYTPEWLQSDRVLELFPTMSAYETFVADYEESKAVLDEIKNELAN